MSLYLSYTGRAGALAKRVADDFKKAQGCAAGSPEEATKNKIGEIAAELCAGFADPNMVVTMTLQTSAYNVPGGKHQSVVTKFEFNTVSPFIE